MRNRPHLEKMQKDKGFTLIELLIVIAVLGILIVAILSAIDPLEQIRKARDSGRKSDSAELLSAYERYFTTYQCYPWDTLAPKCSTIITASRTVPTNPDFTLTGDDVDLMNQGELKSQFGNRNTVTNNELWASENDDRQVSVCFEPESKTGRLGGMGVLRNQTNDSELDCAGSYPDSTCWVCVPQ